MDQKKIILKEVLRIFTETGAFPEIKRFRLDHRDQRSVIEDLIQSRHLSAPGDHLNLRLKGLLFLDTEESRALIKSCNDLIPALQAWYEKNLKQEVSAEHLSHVVKRSINQISRELYFILEHDVWSGSTGHPPVSVTLTENIIDLSSLEQGLKRQGKQKSIHENEVFAKPSYPEKLSNSSKLHSGDFAFEIVSYFLAVVSIVLTIYKWKVVEAHPWIAVVLALAIIFLVLSRSTKVHRGTSVGASIASATSIILILAVPIPNDTIAVPPANSPQEMLTNAFKDSGKSECQLPDSHSPNGKRDISLLPFDLHPHVLRYDNPMREKIKLCIDAPIALYGSKKTKASMKKFMQRIDAIVDYMERNNEAQAYFPDKYLSDIDPKCSVSDIKLSEICLRRNEFHQSIRSSAKLVRENLALDIRNLQKSPATKTDGETKLKAKLEFSFFPLPESNPSNPIETLNSTSLKKDESGIVHIEFYVLNPTMINATDIQLNLIICTACKYAREPLGFSQIKGKPRVRHMSVSAITATSKLEPISVDVIPPPSLKQMEIGFNYRCKDCDIPAKPPSGIVNILNPTINAD